MVGDKTLKPTEKHTIVCVGIYADKINVLCIAHQSMKNTERNTHNNNTNLTRRHTN